MNKIVIIDTNFPINTRNTRLLNLFSSLGEKLTTYVISWDRNLIYLGDFVNFYLFKFRSKPGNKLLKALAFPLYIIFTFNKLVKISPDYIVASHFDSLVISILYKIYNKDVLIIYDCLDMPQSNYRFIQYFFHKLEGFLINNFVHYVVLASRFFKPFYSYFEKVIIVENLLSLESRNYDNNSFTSNNLKSLPYNHGCEIISWIGVVRYPDVLINMIEAAKKLNLKVYIFGSGPSEELLINYVNKNNLNNLVSFFGRYEPNDLPLIYSVSNFVWAAYPTNSFNARYAISNKFHECNYFQVVPLFSKKTQMSKHLKKSGCKSFISFDEYDVEDIVLNIKSFTNDNFMRYEKISYFEDYSFHFEQIFNEKLV